MNTFHVLVIKDFVGEKPLWSAQCLEHDIAAQGNTIEKALMELTKVFVAEDVMMRQIGKSVGDIPKAPQDYWIMFNDAIKVEAKSNYPVMPESAVPASYMIPEFREMRVA